MIVAHNRFLACIAALSLIAYFAADAQAQRGQRGQGRFGGQPGQGQPGQGRFGGAGARFGGMARGGSVELDLLARTDVKQELMLVESQEKEIQALRERINQQRRDLMGQVMRDRPSQEDRRAAFEGIQEKLQSITANAKTELDKLLLAHQSKRLAEIAAQAQLRRGLEQALARGPLADKLGVTEAQRSQLQATRQKVDQKRQQMLEQLRNESRTMYESVLTTEQRSQLQVLTGDPFEFREEPRGEREPGGDPRVRGNRRRPDA